MYCRPFESWKKHCVLKLWVVMVLIELGDQVKERATSNKIIVHRPPCVKTIMITKYRSGKFDGFRVGRVTSWGRAHISMREIQYSLYVL
jgi:hypothetical protein